MHICWMKLHLIQAFIRCWETVFFTFPFNFSTLNYVKELNSDALLNPVVIHLHLRLKMDLPHLLSVRPPSSSFRLDLLKAGKVQQTRLHREPLVSARLCYFLSLLSPSSHATSSDCRFHHRSVTPHSFFFQVSQNLDLFLKKQYLQFEWIKIKY